MPNNFEIIMQLHGEGEPAPAAAPEGGGTDVTVDTGSADTTSAPAQDAEPAGKRYAIEVDPRTQRRKIVLLGNKEENMQEQPAQEEQAPAASTAAPQAEVKQEEPPVKTQEQPLFPQAQQQVLNTEPYKTVAEVVEAIRSNTIDPRRVPLEYAGQVAQLRNAMQAQMQNQAQPAKPVVPQEQARNDFYMKVEQAARENALKAVGITEEELESADYSDDAGLKQRAKQFEAALAWQRNSIVEGVRQRQLQAMQQQQALRQIYADIDN